MKLWVILVPASSPSFPIKLSHHKEWDKKVLSITGGLTIMKPAQGQWISPSGRLYIDRVIPVKIMCERDKIEKVARMTIAHYKQEAVMFYAVSSDVEIMHKV